MAGAGRFPNSRPRALKCKKGTVVEYALRDINTPMGVSTYRTALPDAMAGVLPSIEALTEELRSLQNDDQDDLEPDR